ERVSVRARGVAGIDVEPEFTLAEGADRLAIDLDVGDEQHLLVGLINSLGAAAQRLRRFFPGAEITEIGGEPKLLLLVDRLPAKYQDEVLSPGVLDRGHRLRGKRAGQIDSADLRTA